MKALIIIDMQHDFLEKGRLYVPAGETIIPAINRIQTDYDLVVATQDWHPAHHKSFASQHAGKKIYDVIDLNGLPQVLWPDHCVQGEEGAKLDDRIVWNRVEAIFRKGMDIEIDSYSCFFDNGKRKNTGLDAYLRGRSVDEVHLCGLAADYCVYYSAEDALTLGYQTLVLKDATQAINQDEYSIKQEILRERGVQFL
ncbi:bifunctional nicotinamidase/pyrazinamidase [Sphingobacterium sp. SRCM116780]|uniref:bifunctional nicotinamidase/pyrazinamidase n=1 Tax=Sphingobacterium sp. SRCM116780 TaxID=2907623 RepID=UPI001F165DAB|nr:bifunctional nicotinamidase/pyrazinamidase [Sphingobacterium sp. SRCM116780]UIR55927.1 bifunctional nicotinamidase/pyrazinamidase [Sphingobacterium sp. SRCM116780]